MWVRNTLSRREMKLSVMTAGLVIAAGCAPGARWFGAGPRRSEVAGEWIDVGATTAGDTVAWVLSSDGHDRALHLKVERDASGGVGVRRDEKKYGFWYLEGTRRDTARRAICYKKRARNGGTCVHFSLDTTHEGGIVRRRLTVRDFPGEKMPGGRAFIERLP